MSPPELMLAAALSAVFYWTDRRAALAMTVCVLALGLTNPFIGASDFVASSIAMLLAAGLLWWAAEQSMLTVVVVGFVVMLLGFASSDQLADRANLDQPIGFVDANGQPPKDTEKFVLPQVLCKKEYRASVTYERVDDPAQTTEVFPVVPVDWTPADPVVYWAETRYFDPHLCEVDEPTNLIVYPIKAKKAFLSINEAVRKHNLKIDKRNTIQLATPIPANTILWNFWKTRLLAIFGVACGLLLPLIQSRFKS